MRKFYKVDANSEQICNRFESKLLQICTKFVTVLYVVFFSHSAARNFLPRAYILGVLSKTKKSAHAAPLSPKYYYFKDYSRKQNLCSKNDT